MKNDFDYVREDAPELIKAVKRGRRDRVRELIAEGVDLDVKNRAENGALYWCIMGNRSGIMRDLLKAGADPDIENEHGQLPLLMAIHRHPDMVVMLMEAGADVDKVDAYHSRARAGVRDMTPRKYAQKHLQYPAAHLIADWDGVLEKRAFRAEKKRAIAMQHRLRGHGLKRLKR